MKIFETIQKNFNALGFNANDVLLSAHHIRAILMSISAIISQFVYVLYNVNTVEENMRTIFMLIVGISVFISFVSIVSGKTELNDMIDNVQQIITESKNQSM